RRFSGGHARGVHSGSGAPVRALPRPAAISRRSGAARNRARERLPRSRFASSDCAFGSAARPPLRCARALGRDAPGLFRHRFGAVGGQFRALARWPLPTAPLVVFRQRKRSTRPAALPLRRESPVSARLFESLTSE